ncbi:hypothetical protein BC938DRAFT_474833 [Jimgerdemannia flammicorona]|uniref:Uncharacterized protein n=1 Tax=Jimgerdemannia flammicorona TaxID=994334 RepID=A0A433Q1G7_9FUNG|nr:hypothetical protein BC938DRAFT_474833 [Jimgerdemannia flammicorona]
MHLLHPQSSNALINNNVEGGPSVPDKRTRGQEERGGANSPYHVQIWPLLRGRRELASPTSFCSTVWSRETRSLA